MRTEINGSLVIATFEKQDSIEEACKALVKLRLNIIGNVTSFLIYGNLGAILKVKKFWHKNYAGLEARTSFRIRCSSKVSFYILKLFFAKESLNVIYEP